MQKLNLIDKDRSDIGYKVISFPDGESHIVLEEINRKDMVNVFCRIANPDDLFLLMQVGDILNRQEVQFKLNISYLMGMRMDRVMSFNEAFSLKVVANVINLLNAKKVQILDQHSDKTMSLIHNSYNAQPNLQFILEDTICFPDKGAADRYMFSIKETWFKKPVLICNKKRDLHTGELSGFEILNPEVYTGGSICVVDDLCDAGGTFAGVSKEIRKIAPNAELNIQVTHMVNPKGIVTLSEHYDHVTFTDSFYNWSKLYDLPKNVTCKTVWNYESN